MFSHLLFVILANPIRNFPFLLWRKVHPKHLAIRSWFRQRPDNSAVEWHFRKGRKRRDIRRRTIEGGSLKVFEPHSSEAGPVLGQIITIIDALEQQEDSLGRARVQDIWYFGKIDLPNKHHLSTFLVNRP